MPVEAVILNLTNGWFMLQWGVQKNKMPTTFPHKNRDPNYIGTKLHEVFACYKNVYFSTSLLSLTLWSTLYYRLELERKLRHMKNYNCDIVVEILSADINRREWLISTEDVAAQKDEVKAASCNAITSALSLSKPRQVQTAARWPPHTRMDFLYCNQVVLSALAAVSRRRRRQRCRGKHGVGTETAGPSIRTVRPRKKRRPTAHPHAVVVASPWVVDEDIEMKSTKRGVR